MKWNHTKNHTNSHKNSNKRLALAAKGREREKIISSLAAKAR